VDEPEVVDLEVESGFPAAKLDEIVQQLGAAVVVEDERGFGGEFIVRCFGGCDGFVEYAIENQGYGKVVRKRRRR
jgi:hypothetical protein